MQNRANLSKKSDLILGVTALIVVGGLCLKGAYSLYETSESQKETTMASHLSNPQATLIKK